MSKPLAATNDFVVKFANVNGSGSASANGLFAKVILRMGVPVGARNIFPSNIQGLPTWYEVRVTEAGWLGRRGGVDLMVAMNPQTWDADVKGIEPGGYLLYDQLEAAAGVEIPRRHHHHRRAADRADRQRSSPIRASASCSRTSAMSACWRSCSGIDVEVVKQLLSEEFKGKDKLIAAELQGVRARPRLSPRSTSRRSA